MPVHGGKLAARALKQAGVEVLFTLPGGHIMPLYDGCLDEGIRIVDVRHEPKRTFMISGATPPSWGETKMAAKKKAGTISKLRKAMAKDVASLKANHRRDAAALKRQVVAARKRARAEVAKLKREASAEIAKLKKVTKKKATRKKTARKKR